MQSLNHLLLEHARYEEFFATVCSVVINPPLSDATITLAGHPPPILTSGGVVIPLELPIGVPLGVSDAAHWSPARVALPAVFSLLLYTDGVIEGRVRALPGERFGEQRLIDLLTAASSGGRELLQQILLSATSARRPAARRRRAAATRTRPDSKQPCAPTSARPPPGLTEQRSDAPNRTSSA